MAGFEVGANNASNLARVPLSDAGLRVRAEYLSGTKDINELARRTEGDPQFWRGEAYGAFSLVIEELYRRILVDLRVHPMKPVPKGDDWWNRFCGHYYKQVPIVEKKHYLAWRHEISKKDPLNYTAHDKAFLGMEIAKDREDVKKRGSNFIPSSQDAFLIVGSLARVANQLHQASAGRDLSVDEMRTVLGGKGVDMFLKSEMINSHDVSLDFHDKLIARDKRGYDPRHFVLHPGPPLVLSLKPGVVAKYREIIERNLPRYTPARQQELTFALRCPVAYSTEWQDKLLQWVVGEAVRQYTER